MNPLLCQLSYAAISAKITIIRGLTRWGFEAGLGFFPPRLIGLSFLRRNRPRWTAAVAFEIMAPDSIFLGGVGLGGIGAERIHGGFAHRRG